MAEHVNGEMNVIESAMQRVLASKMELLLILRLLLNAIKTAVSQAEEKAGISINVCKRWITSESLQIEATQGMIPVTSDSKEITDADVENVVKSALTKSMTPDREVITFIPEEFTVDGFQGFVTLEE